MYANRMNNDMAVSPIVATLVLIVVAVIGAVAVGTIMGTFSTDVSKNANTGDVAGASTTEILVAGSTTLLPPMQLVAKEYMASHPGIKVTVQGGGSGAGLSSIANQIADIGMMSEDLTTTQKAAYPTIKQFQVGASGVVVITSTLTGAAPATVGAADLKTVYDGGAVPAALAPLNAFATRSDKSGTADTFAKFINANNIYAVAGSVTAYSGNGALVTYVGGAANRAGFTDFDYATTAATVKIIPYTGFAGPYTAAMIKDGYNNVASTQFPHGATRPLFLITNGEPNSIANSLITYAQSPAAQANDFKQYNVTHISELVKA